MQRYLILYEFSEALKGSKESRVSGYSSQWAQSAKEIVQKIKSRLPGHYTLENLWTLEMSVTPPMLTQIYGTFTPLPPALQSLKNSKLPKVPEELKKAPKAPIAEVLAALKPRLRVNSKGKLEEIVPDRNGEATPLALPAPKEAIPVSKFERTTYYEAISWRSFYEGQKKKAKK